ncbi:MAG: efflux RND transporter periplasmic adaptor subunit [Acidobacteriota bacterium]
MIGKSRVHMSESRRVSWGGARLGFLFSALAGFVIAYLLLANPLGLSFLDTWARKLVGHGKQVTGAQSLPSGEQRWSCGMHPQVLQDRPGLCPICGMNLVPVGGGEEARRVPSPPARPSGERQILFYRHPMNPGVTSPEPMKDEMGMDFVPVYAEDAQPPAAERPTVTIDPAVVQKMGVVTEEVIRRDVSRRIRTVGYLQYDQEKMVSVTTKYEGFVEKVYVNYIGQPVERGEPLFEIYSPELVQTEQELLSALEFAKRMRDAPEDARRRAEALVEAAMTRLSYWDITPAQVERLKSTGEVFRALAVVAPISGLVMKRMPGLEGMSVRPGMEVIHIADLSSLWLEVEVFEDQLPWLKQGSTASIFMTYFPAKKLSGRIRYIEPAISEKTRTVKVTLEVPNQDGRLRVGMYATVDFEPVIAANAITVPSYAILRTGTRNIVVVALGEGRFAPRDVTLGPKGDGWVQVLSGLEEGEKVVTSGQFLIDSESNLREAIKKMITGRAERGS